MFKTVNDGKLPTRGSKFSACVDLYANEDVSICLGGTKMVGLGVMIGNIDKFIENHLKKDYGLLGLETETQAFVNNFKGTHYLQLMLRSSLGKKGLILPNGVGIIDIDYKDEIKMIIHNPNVCNVFEYDRHVNGVKMAEGITISTATSFEEAIEKAQELIKNYDDFQDTTLSIRKAYYKIKKGDRIAQITLLEHKGYLFDIHTEDDRDGGFGSTGDK